MGKLLVVDDDEALRGLMRLELSGAYEIIDSGEPEQGLALAPRTPARGHLARPANAELFRL